MTGTPVPSLETWIEGQLAVSTGRLLAAVSATGLARPGPRRGRTTVPAAGSVLASAGPDPGPDEPDYFFHWIRDAALVVDALLALHRLGRLPDAARARFAETIAFDRRLSRIDGRALAKDGSWPPDVLPRLRPWLRPRKEMAALHGRTVAADVRYNPDGTPDLLRWSRPQHDGPALRALSTLGILESEALTTPSDVAWAERQLDADLGFCLGRHTQPCYDPWEEEHGHHFHTRLVLHAAMLRGTRRAESGGRGGRAARFAAASRRLSEALHRHWSPDEGIYRSRMPGPGIDDGKALDSIVLLAVLQAGPPDGPFSVLDPRVAATVDRLERFFAGHLPVNAGRRPADGILLGRYRGDRYFDGGAFLPASLALAEFHYRRQDRTRGDAVLSVLQRFLPEPGPLPEQLDRATGVPRSARDLSWSHAAFVMAAEARTKIGRPAVGRPAAIGAG